MLYRKIMQSTFLFLLVGVLFAVSFTAQAAPIVPLEEVHPIATANPVNDSAEEVVAIAENENKDNMKRLASYIDGIINLTAFLGLLLPLYKVEENELFYSVPLYQLGGWQGVVFWIAPVIMVICGIAQMVLAENKNTNMNTGAKMVGNVAHISTIILLILCGHPYPAVLFFFLFAMKGTLILKIR